MRNAPIIAAAGLALVFGLAACSTADTPADPVSATSRADESMKSDMKGEDSAMDDMHHERDGAFQGQGEKSVTGTVSVTNHEIALSGFSADEGPALQVYLANGSDLDAVSSGVAVGDIEFDQATQTFALEGIEAADFSHVVICCEKAKVVFGAARVALGVLWLLEGIVKVRSGFGAPTSCSWPTARPATTGCRGSSPRSVS